MVMKPVKQDIQINKTIPLNYLLHMPEQAYLNSDERWPTILFLHGRGESGEDLTAVSQQGLPQYIADKPDFPFIVIAPQCPWKSWWPEQADNLAAILNECISTYPIDTTRLYLTGLSMGGFGSWYLGCKWPDRFTAVAPICGGGYWFHGFPEQVEALKSTPVWAFHGAIDSVVPMEMSQILVDTLRDCGGDVKFTIYPDAEHDAWTETYNNPELYAWVLRHKR